MVPVNDDSPLAPVLTLLTEGAADGAWRKCVLTSAKGSAREWQKFVAQPVQLSRGPAVKVVTTAGGSESTRMVPPGDWEGALMGALEGGPCHLDVLAVDHDWHARKTKSGRWLVSRGKASLPAADPTLAPHDRKPSHQLDPATPRALRFLIETGLFAKSGKLLGEGADKYRQVQHYLELLRPLPIWESGGTVRILDAGCGKAYLSLALLLWAEQRGYKASLVGVDSSPAVISAVTGIAERCGLEVASFEATSILEYARRDTSADLLVSLHACDMATDEALAAGVRLGAKAIVLVPCCHNELSEQIEAAAKSGELPAAARWQAGTRYGLTRHRLADIVTDSLRAAALEALGYKVDVVEFVTPEITARNLMIRAVKRAATDRARAFETYRALADEWAVKPTLEGLLGDMWPPSA
jgi:SAM-dependent methyltransferase